MSTCSLAAGKGASLVFAEVHGLDVSVPQLYHHFEPGQSSAIPSIRAQTQPESMIDVPTLG